MLDDDARRSLEEEAIALVSLSRPPLRFAPQNAAPPHQHQNPQVHSHSRNRPLLPDKVNRSSSTSSNGDAQDGRDGQRGGAGLHPSGEELYAQNPAAEQPQQDGGGISMKSLLVTLKKRKLPAEDDAAAAERERMAKVLPSFRDVFEPPPRQSQPQPAEEPSPEQPGDAASATTVGELKCKYRTGKCSNARALKSCGDYHNLCNYHRLRANANQRKLDRKKKVQRLQVNPVAGGALSSSASASSPSSSSVGADAAPTASGSAATVSMLQSTIAVAASSLASSVAAAVVLVAMPSSAPAPLPRQQQVGPAHALEPSRRSSNSQQ